MSQIEYSIVVPVFCAENVLEELHKSICQYFQKYTYEIIYIDDCSIDNSWACLKKIKQTNTDINITIIKFNKNFGQHAATICGFKHAKGKFVITMDDDMEVSSSEMEKLITQQTGDNCDLVYAEYTKLNQSIFRSFFTKVYKFISKIEGKQKGRGSSYRLLKNSLAKKVADNHKQFVFIDELCLWYTKKLSFVNVVVNKGIVRKTRYKMSNLFSLTGNVIMFSSTFPLKLVTQIGLGLSTVNFLLGIRFLIKKFYFKIDVPGYTSIIVSILFSTGLIIFCIGILAQYLTQVLKAVNNSPAYYEDEVIC